MAEQQDGLPLVYILLLNYRGAEDTLACLDSLRRLDYPNVKIVVVDNASGDGSIERLEHYNQSVMPPAFHLICSKENLGFGGGNNLGIQYALEHGADYVWLLNNDAVAEPGALSHLLKEAEKTGGLVGSLLLYPNRAYQQVGTRINWATGHVEGIPETALRDGMAVTALSGASMLIPAKAVRRIGLFDHSYFLYFEDVDYCLRATDLSYPVTVALRSRVFHKEGASTGKHSLQTRYYYQRNRLMLLMNYASPLERITIGLYTIFRVFRSIIKGWSGDPDRRASARVHWLAFVDFIEGTTGPCPHHLMNP